MVKKYLDLSDATFGHPVNLKLTFIAKIWHITLFVQNKIANKYPVYVLDMFEVYPKISI